MREVPWLCFCNLAPLEPELFKSFGVSVKDKEDPIGYFGTGLKYAIAIILRLGGEIKIHSHGCVYEFGLTTKTIRSKNFNFITCNGEQLGFTTDVGINWEPWMAYRELRSNCIDENGRIEILKEVPVDTSETIVAVKCPLIFETHSSNNVFLCSSPLWTNQFGEIHPGPSKWVYYRSIRVLELVRASSHTYNITRDLRLTEDRTADVRDVENSVKDVLTNCPDSDIFRTAFLNTEAMEWHVDYYAFAPYSEGFLDNACKTYAKSPGMLPQTLINVLRKLRAKVFFNEYPPSVIEQLKLKKAINFAKRIGFDPSPYKITIIESFGNGILAAADRERNSVILSREIINAGTKQLVSAIVEEVVHLRTGHGDYSRALQTYLFDYIITQAEELHGEVL